MTRDEEIRRVVAEADAIMDRLRINVDALRMILLPPPPEEAPGDGKELIVP